AQAPDLRAGGPFSVQTGALRDVVRSHPPEVLPLVAMEPPVSFKADDQRDERVQVLRSLRPIVGGDVAVEAVRGQYRGYPGEKDGAPGPRPPTPAAAQGMVGTLARQGGGLPP